MIRALATAAQVHGHARFLMFCWALALLLVTILVAMTLVQALHLGPTAGMGFVSLPSSQQIADVCGGGVSGHC